MRMLIRRPTRSRRRAWAAASLAFVSVLATVAGGAAESSPAPGASAAPLERITLSALGDVSSLDATVTITATGTMGGQQMQGDLTADLSSNDQAQSRIDITGSLLGPVATKVGGGIVGLFRPSKVTVLTTDATYIVVSGLTDLCVKPSDPSSTSALSQLSPQGLMTTLTSSDQPIGRFVGEETLDGEAVRHYVIDGQAFLAAAASSTDPTVHKFASSLTSAADADLFVAADTGYPVKYAGAFSGRYEPLDLAGDFSVNIDVTGIDTNPVITLPGACELPISV
jgi:hypothetical protein